MMPNIFDSTYEDSFAQDIEFIHSLVNELPDIQYIERPEKKENRHYIETEPIFDNHNKIIKEQGPRQMDEWQNYPIHIQGRKVTTSYYADGFPQPTDGFNQTIKSDGMSIQRKTLCPICHEGDPGKHKHYGGKACTSCRAFFRRSVENEAYTRFKCIYSDEIDSSGNHCLISSRSWVSCRYCRFHKCLSSGLKVSLVLTPQERELRKKKRCINKRNRHDSLNKCYAKSYFSSPNSNTLCTTSFADEEVVLITYNVKQLMTEYMQKDMARFLMENPSSWDTILKMCFDRQPSFDVKDFYNKQKMGSLRRSVFERFLLNTYREHSALSPLLVQKLFDQNMPTVNFILSALNIGNSVVPSPLKELLQDVYERRKYLSTYLPHFPSYQQEIDLAMNQGDEQDNYYNFVTILAMRTIRKNIKMSQSTRAPDFDEAYPCQSLMSPEKETLKVTLRRNLEEVAKWPIFTPVNEKISKQKKPTPNNAIEIDYVLFTLLILISLYATHDSSDGSIVSSEVEKLQHQHLNLLHKYLKFTYPERAYNLLASGISAISKAQEASNILQIHF